MSNRHLKRLEQQNGLQGIAASVGDVEPEPPIEDDLAVKPVQRSIFQLLADASNDEGDESEAKASAPPEPASTADEAEAGDRYKSKPASEASKTKPKRKNRNKMKKKKRQEEAEWSTASKGSTAEVDDELEKELRYIEDKNQPVRSGSTNTPELALKTALSFQAKYLNPERELRQKFGASVVREERQHHYAGLPRNLGKRVVAPVSRGFLIPDAALHYMMMRGRKIGGITMEPVPDRVGYFEYKFSPDYWRTQAEFMLLVNSLNQDDIFGMLQRIGDHVDTLLQVATICRMGEDKTRAAESIEQAIFVLEKAFHSAFDLPSGNCRLDYRAKPNRSLFIALFQHAYYLSERGCPRTAMEVCKVLLSLDPEFDPLAVLLVIDHYALRAQEDEWLINFFEAFQQAGRNLHQLVNFAYSAALANFRLKRYDEADRLLRKALLNFPQALKAIADKNSIMMDRKTASVFDKVYPDDLTVRLYAERCAYLYREPEVMRWMERATMQIVDSGIKPVTVRSVSSLPRNVLRHIMQSHVPGVTLGAQDLPADAQPMYDFDPFPPKDAYGDLSPELLPITADDMLSESTLANFLNSLHPAWTGRDENTVHTAANNVVEGVSDLLDMFINLMSDIGGANNQAPTNGEGGESVEGAGPQADASAGAQESEENDRDSNRDDPAQ